MKFLYILRSVAHYPYQRGIIERLLAAGHEIKLLADQEWSQYRSDRAIQDTMAAHPGLTFEWAMRRSDKWNRTVLAVRELLSFISYLRREDQSDYYLERWGSYQNRLLRPFVKLAGVRALLKKPLVEAKLREFERRVPTDVGIRRWVSNFNPDAVIASPMNMRYSAELDYVKAAKICDIPTIVPVLSWDNLTTKGLLHEVPDLTLVWNTVQEEEAVRIHSIPREKIAITGSPFFDKWFDIDEGSLDKVAFYEKAGLNPNKKFVLYLGSSQNIAKDERWLIRNVVKALKESEHPDVRELEFLLRPHTAHAKLYKDLTQEGIKIWPKWPFPYEKGVPDTQEAINDFYLSMRLCSAVVGLNTSGMIDAMIVDKPCIALITKEYSSTQSGATHFQNLVKAGILETAGTAEECADRVHSLLNGHDSTTEKRRDFVRGFARPLGINRSAAELCVRAIELAAARLRPEAIRAELKRFASRPSAKSSKSLETVSQ